MVWSALAAVVAVVALAAVPAAGQGQKDGTYTTPRTPWGDPDFQGSWENRTPTPLERAEEFGTREFLTEEEIAERARRGVSRLPDGEEGAIADDLVAADIARESQSNSIDANRPGKSISGNEYNAFWNAPVSARVTTMRTSQIIAPPQREAPGLYARGPRAMGRARSGESRAW